MRRPSRATLLVTLLLSACSAPSYQKQVSDLSGALSKVKSSFETLAEDERQTFVQLQTRRGLRKDFLIQIPGDCINERPGRVEVNLPGCRPQIRSLKDDTVRTIDFKAAVPRGLQAAGLVADYGTSLVGLTESKDIAELQDAVEKAGAAVTKLQQDVSRNKTSTSFGAVTTFVTWAVGKYLDAMRFEQLRAVVREADPVVADAANLLSQQASKLQESLVAQKGELLNLSSTELARLRSGGDVATIDKTADTLVGSAIALQQFARTDVTSPFKKMRAAHAALLAGLENPEVSPEAVFAQISEFVDQVDKLKKGLEPPKGGK
jgi:hypothetical protein